MKIIIGSFWYAPNQAMRMKHAQLSTFKSIRRSRVVRAHARCDHWHWKIKVHDALRIIWYRRLCNRQYSYENDVWLAYSLPAYVDQEFVKWRWSNIKLANILASGFAMLTFATEIRNWSEPVLIKWWRQKNDISFRYVGGLMGFRYSIR